MNEKRIIAVDFDGTLCENEWPWIGEPNEALIAYLKTRQSEGDEIILWTCRTEKLLAKAVNWCSEHGLIFDAVNENTPETLERFGGESRKIYADEYIDDKMSNGGVTLPYVSKGQTETSRQFKKDEGKENEK